MASSKKKPTYSATSSANAKSAPKVTSIGNFKSVDEFTKSGLAEVIEATKSINAFPAGTSRDLYCAYPTFGKIVDTQSDRILGIICKVMKQRNIRGNIQRRQQDEQFELLLECNDTMLERVNSNLDELAGIKKNPQTIVVESKLNTPISSKGVGSWNTKRTDASPMSARLITARNIARPQIKFKIPIDNRAMVPFIPKLKDKPNSLKPLAILPEYDDDGNIASYLHPYEFELIKFKASEAQLQQKTPVPPKDIDATPLVYVDTVVKLKAVVLEIHQYTEIAIDVEHHSYRTFQGITCLVQISTPAKDYIFDALELREDMHLLNNVFTDPKVVKIFHGADSDIEWLQRDLSLYIVNMFDTHQAAKALNMARLSLSYLLKHYCNIDADKTFQLADWRIRPLPQELITYARQDTHFLIYVYECITNDLLNAGNGQTNILKVVYQRSTEICKKRYIKPIVTENSHIDFFRKSKRIFDNRQLFALGEIYQWRDKVARQEDESCGYVLPNHMMLQISESLPREMQGILACCNPIPPLVRQNLHTLHQIILRARDQPLVKPIFETDAINRTIISNTKDCNSKLYCPHDLSHCEEFRDDLPTLLKFNDNQNDQLQSNTNNECESPSSVKEFLKPPALSILCATEKATDEEAKQKLEKIEQIKFVSPYERYLVALPMIEQEKREEAARLKKENDKKQLCPNVLEATNDKKAVTNGTTTTADDDLYNIPIKEYLKRKYEESVAKKQTAAAATASTITDDGSPLAKKIRKEHNKDDHLKFVQIPEANVNNGNVTKDAGNNQSEDDPANSFPSVSQTHQNRQPQPTSNRSNKKRKNKFKSHNNRTGQSSDTPVVNFDYQKVDYKKFQGGAQRAKGLELKPQFRGKVNSNKANNKKFNKLFTFSNVKGNKK